MLRDDSGMHCTMYWAMHVEKSTLMVMGVFTHLGIGIFLWVLSLLGKIGGARLRWSSDRETSEIGTEGTKPEQSLTHRRFY